MDKNQIKNFFRDNKNKLLVVGAACVLTVALMVARAAGPLAQFETESANLSGSATVKSASAASGGKYVEFSQANVEPAGSNVGPRSVSCPSGASNINPGDNIQNAVNSKSTGAAFCIKAGTHVRQRVIPKSGNIFIGEKGAVLDGQNAEPYAFAGGGGNVTIENLVIRNYKQASRDAAVDRQTPGGAAQSGWIVRFNEIHGNNEVGLRTFGNWKVSNNYVHHNGRYGMTGSGKDTLIENNEIANNATIYGATGDSSGTKWVHTERLILRGNYAHHNQGNGLWVDINNVGGLVENNVSSFNTRSGIFWEISCDAVIRNNFLESNGSEGRNPDWMSGTNGIAVANSPGVEVYGNTVINNHKGIGAINWDHNNLDAVKKCTPELQDLNVHDNRIVHKGERVAGISANRNASQVYTQWNNRFHNNTYETDSTGRWRWSSGWLTQSQWRNIFPGD